MERLKVLLLLLFLCIGIKANSQSTIESIGDVNLYAIPTIAIGTSFLKKDYKGIVQYAKAGALNAALTFGLKGVVSKRRPDGSDFDSFPSAHTSATFQGAAYLQKRYGWSYGVPAYLLASFTGYSRVYAKKHYVEDVIVGAFFGVASAYLFTTEWTKNISFKSNRKNVMVTYNYEF